MTPRAPDQPWRMDHTALIRSLSPDTKARLNARSDLAGLKHLALYLLALTLTSAGIIAQIPLWPLLMIPQGILLVFLFTLSHECTHQTPFATPWLNEACGHAIAPLLGLPFIWFRYFHLAHHRYTNDPTRDPEIAAQPALRAYLLAEHGLRPPVADMFENSRTTYTSRAIRALAWNMPYHAEHHSLPQVPFHQLPALHDLTRPHLKSTSQGYVEFSADYLRSLDPRER